MVSRAVAASTAVLVFSRIRAPRMMLSSNWCHGLAAAGYHICQSLIISCNISRLSAHVAPCCMDMRGETVALDLVQPPRLWRGAMADAYVSSGLGPRVGTPIWVRVGVGGRALAKYF